MLKSAILFSLSFSDENVSHTIFIELNNKIRIVHVSWSARSLTQPHLPPEMVSVHLKAKHFSVGLCIYIAYGVARRNDSFFFLAAGLAH